MRTSSCSPQRLPFMMVAAAVVVVVAAWTGGRACGQCPYFADLDSQGVGAMPVNALAVFNGVLHAGTDNGVYRLVGGQWEQLGSTAGAGSVLALAMFNGELYAGGSFSTIGGVNALRIARRVGNAWMPLETGANLAVRALLVFNGELWVGGDFTMVGAANLPASRIATWDGSTWNDLPGMSGAGSPRVFALAAFNGQLYAGGAFANAGSAMGVNNIARWNTVVGNWVSVGGGVSGGLPSARVMIVFTNELVVGGQFTMAGATPVNNIARWTGAAWLTFGTGLSSTVPIALTPHGAGLVAGGLATACCNLMRWDGVNWTAVGCGLGGGAGGQVVALAIYNQELIAGGTFVSLAGCPGIAYIARLNDCPAACCLNGTCILADAANCLAAGGQYFGPDTSCAMVTCPQNPCPSDINLSGAVDVDDLIQVILDWGNCPVE